MPNSKVRFTIDALEDIRELRQWYRKRNPRLVDVIDLELRRLTTAIAQRPLSYPIVHHPYRRALLRKFPYMILFEQEENRSLVFACMHTRRGDRQWINEVLRRNPMPAPT